MLSSELIINATREIFETMVMKEVLPGDALSEPIKSFRNSISGIVGLAGTYQGMLAIHASEGVALEITKDFLGLESEEIDDEVKDAIGELANMIAGSVKPELSPNGKDIQLSIPSVIYGDYTLNYFTNAEWSVIPFRTNSGDFFVELEIKNVED